MQKTTQTLQKDIPYKRRVEINKGKKMFLLILPFLALSFLFSYFPLHGWIYALYDYRAPLKLSKCAFVGFKWFKLLFSNSTQLAQLGQVMQNTFAMSFLGIATSFLPLMFAVFLNEIKCVPFKKFVQTFTTIPNFISWVLVYSIGFNFFSNSGLLNTLLKEWGVIEESIKILDGDNHTYLIMMLWGLWKSLGWNAIIYFASISGIDQELYEAARVDGGNRFQLMRYITIPELMPTFLVLLMLSIANFLSNGMDQYYVFQNAFNKQHIQVLDLYVYNIGLSGNSISLATAIGIMKSVISVSLLTFVNVLSKKVRGTSII